MKDKRREYNERNKEKIKKQKQESYQSRKEKIKQKYQKDQLKNQEKRKPDGETRHFGFVNKTKETPRRKSIQNSNEKDM